MKFNYKILDNRYDIFEVDIYVNFKLPALIGSYRMNHHICRINIYQIDSWPFSNATFSMQVSFINKQERCVHAMIFRDHDLDKDFKCVHIKKIINFYFDLLICDQGL